MLFSAPHFPLWENPSTKISSEESVVADSGTMKPVNSLFWIVMFSANPVVLSF